MTAFAQLARRANSSDLRKIKRKVEELKKEKEKIRERSRKRKREKHFYAFSPTCFYKNENDFARKKKKKKVSEVTSSVRVCTHTCACAYVGV
ncbi:hypothetical protein POVWA1_002470 [Plasmodium ovale wallikeri]|uniref:Uncharacterized protein n=1 Tax=Plasmodium ovale wallikeri TaxID=864142 RepID=A0A1A8YGA4_PLAOA|nr:hypothetical protein POVWA1_002470 [Plasmodium ovale wallikeri]